MRSFSLSVLGRATLFASALLGLCATRPASAQYSGFQINRYEPTAAGEWSFLVDHPWYSKTRYFAGGLTLNYGHNPLIFGYTLPNGSLTNSTAVIAHQVTGHIDLAGSFLNRVLITASLPINFYEGGQTAPGTNVGPASGAYVSDPRIGAWVRIFGEPYGSAISLSAGGQLWIPLRAFTDSIPQQGSDQMVRGSLKLALGGLSRHVLWSTTVAAHFRAESQLGGVLDPLGRTASHELQIGAAIAYADMEKRFSVGPEVALATAMTSNMFQQYSTSLEVLAAGHYNIARLINIGIAGGAGILRQAGTPDGRVLFRLAYAPMAKPVPKDRDRDGVADPNDLCPDEPQGDRPDPERLGCPQRDRDRDGVYDREDLCPDQPKGNNPDPERLGCPAADSDGDGLFDYEDKCPDKHQGQNPDPARPGCPAGDRDGDAIVDHIDQCPDQPKGPNPDPARPGCPAGDRDNDGVFDHDDLCPDQAAGVLPDPNKRGCPLPDRDRDMVHDAIDACPNEPGVPDADPKKNGCPNKYVVVTGGQVVIREQIFFDYKKDTIQKRSFPVLQAVADALNLAPQIKKVRIEGHTDNIGPADYNLGLSTRRAQSVLRWLVERKVAESRLESQGYGMTRPIADNGTKLGQAKNRRVDFIIIDPPQSNAQTETPSKPAVSDTPSVSTSKPAAPPAPAAPPEKPAKPEKKKKGKKADAEPIPAGEAPAAKPAAPDAAKPAEAAAPGAPAAPDAKDQKPAKKAKKGKAAKGADAAAPADAAAAPAVDAAKPAEAAAPGAADAKDQKPAKKAKKGKKGAKDAAPAAPAPAP